MYFIRNIFIKILQWQASVVLWKYKPQVVVVTGSIGKTSTKDAIFNVLSQFYYVRKSEKNFNNDIGVPLTILGLSTGWRNPIKWIINIIRGFVLIIFPLKYPKWLVLEVGIRKPGDMEELKRWVKPHIIVVSAFGIMPSHVEFFEDKNGVWKEEASIIDTLQSDGILLLNHDDPEVLKLFNRNIRNTFTFGTHVDATMRMGHIETDYHPARIEAQGTIFRIDYEGKSIPVHIHEFLGNNVVYASGAALLVAHVLKLPIVQSIEGLTNGSFPSGRMRIIPGVKETMIIDDTYNSSPSAVQNALEVLKRLRSIGKKIAVLGDMLDLGKYTDEEHRKIGKFAATRCDVLVTVGIRSQSIAKAALDAGMHKRDIFVFDDSQEAGKFVEEILRKGDIALMKGSQGVRMERAVLEVMAYPQERKDLLVRQEEEWVSKA